MSNYHNHEHHNHEHHSHIPKNKVILAWSFAIITGFMLVEFFAGYQFNSLTLIADAGHMANDSLSLFLALISLYLSTKSQKRFALLNGGSLIFVAIMILYEAINRWNTPIEIVALPMLTVAVVGLLINIFVAWLMIKGDHSNLNIKAAYLHVLADLLGSVIAIIAGLSAWLLNWQWVDIVASGLLSIFILKSGISITRQAVQELTINQ
ncbi:cation diffusion facilitator family transporter [Rodentibacter caecimuris]|uniref:Co/Zn/Cd efflux system protein n=1 Tax=Rodentibacter caecimuris TaxID=1796644 RepID=A0ABX3KWQ9_9PAST|nr:Co/Zn/Cd efflux system protein [Rodentibacter heylii]